MTKVAISSDNHLDVNRVDLEATLTAQTQYLRSIAADYYFHIGDLFNDFAQTQDYMQQLQQRLAGQTRVYYLAGNHDMMNHASFDQLESLPDAHYLHNRFIDLPGSQWRVIGNNGWYDYGFSQYAAQPERVASWKRVYWLDSAAEQPMSDLERIQRVLQQVRGRLLQAQADGRRVLFLTHFAPRHELLAPRPARVNTPRHEKVFEMIQAMLGSDRLGELLESFPNVSYVAYGHLHNRHPALSRGHVTYLHQAVGVRNRRVNEWQRATFIEQWQATLRVLNLSSKNDH